MNRLYILFLSTFLLGVNGLHGEEMRSWTSSDGKVIEGTILGLEGETITLKTERGQFEVPLSRLADSDQEYAKGWLEAKMKPQEEEGTIGKNMAPQLGNFEDLTLGEWPQYVVADLDVDQIEEVEVESTEDPNAAFVYRSPHFEFRSPERLSTSVVREFSRIFEATYNFVDEMPIGLAPTPDSSGYYPTQLYMKEDDYYADGGMEGSGGMMGWTRANGKMTSIIKVPLPNLGVQYTGTRFVVDHKKRSTTLTHEIVHQVMMRWLQTPMPTWLSEGLAEVVSSQTYDNGRFKLSSMDRSIFDEVMRGRSGREFRMVPLEKLMNITGGEWASELASGIGGQNYDSANLLAYYFLRLDGEGNAAHLVEYIKALTSAKRDEAAAAQTEHLLRGRSYEELQEDLSKEWRGEGLRIDFGM